MNSENETLENEVITGEETTSVDSDEVNDAVEGHDEADDNADSELDNDDDYLNDDDSDESDDNGSNSAFAGVRKGALEKGLKKGFKTGYAEGVAAEQQRQQSLYSQSQSEPSQPNNAPQINQTVSEQAATLQYRDSLGRSTYNDWNTVTTRLAAQAKYEADYGDPSLASIINKAASLPDGEKIIYKLAKNPGVLAKLKVTSPVMQIDKLAGLIKTKSKTKVANKPVQEVKAPPTNGGGKETDFERNARVRESLFR